MSRPQPDRKYLACARLVTSVMSVLVRREWQGLENIPASGPVIICVNHVSYVDPVAVAHALISRKAYPYFLAKESLFSVPIVGMLMRAAKQVPVARQSAAAGRAYQAAENILAAGHVLVVFPEGTITRRDDYWPMPPRSGAARLALASGAPVVPVATFGGQKIAPAYGRGRLNFFQTSRVRIRFGKPLVFGQNPTPTAAEVTQVSEQIMSKIVSELSVLRHELTPSPGETE